MTDLTVASGRRHTIRGVNLGGWLVLEKWITPSLFAGVEANDEYSLCEKLGEAKYSRLETHRSQFIRQADFAWLAGHGITAVRIPVRHTILGDVDPYIGALEYLDKAFEWAEELGMKVLIDMHGAPGWDHPNGTSSVDWHKDQANIKRLVMAIGRLAERYGKRTNLLGIEFLNEPNNGIPKRVLFKYYQQAYAMVQKFCKPDVLVIVSDAYRPAKYSRALKRQKWSRAVLDMHLYQVFSDRERKMPLQKHLKKTSSTWARQLKKYRKRTPIIVGEWSLALDNQSLPNLNGYQKHVALRAYGAAQLLTYEATEGWFYWTYKTEGGGAWNFRDCVERGLLPSNFSEQ